MYGEEISDEVKEDYFETNLKAAKIGLVESMCEVANLYYIGFGVEKNLDEAIKWLEKAVDEGDESAAVTLGRLYSVYIENKNIEKAIFYLLKATHKNHIAAIRKLTEIYESQNEFEKMFECCQRGANLGNGRLMGKLADCYFFGRGVQQDDLKALEWYIKVIEVYGWDSFNNNIMRMITKIYNKHFKFRDKKFLKYYVTTEKLGHFNAMFGIAAELYKTDRVRALKWYKMAADAGDYDAAVAVYYIKENDLYEDTFVDSDRYHSALEWYEKAAHFGNISAAKNLAILNLKGFDSYYGGYLPDVKNSLSWLKKVLKLEAERVGNKDV